MLRFNEFNFINFRFLAGIFDRYKVSIDPQDAFHSEMYVDKESEPPGPAQAAFYGLIPGRAYTITVQALSKDQISKPMVGRYRTVPNGK